jgi:hypothetical protein
MTFRKIALLLATSVCMLLLTASCSEMSVGMGPVVSSGPGNGPPPHAPAYGYRRKHVSGVELVYDSGLGVYVVVGLADHYYHDGYFYRLRGGVWEMSLKPNSGWAAVSMASLPPGLQAKGNGRNHDNGKGNGNSNGKGRGHGKNKKMS